jgi:serine/threonine protein kinase
MTATKSLPIPKEWPKEVSDNFDPVRVLGKGGFASVILARDKTNSKALVAMKIVGGDDSFQRAYAHREMDILRELDHPNIMKVLNSWQPKIGSAVIALSYSKGPTLEALLRHGGALSTSFARVVFAQATDAIAYLHSHAGK